MKNADQKPAPTLTGTILFEGREIQVADFLFELENLAKSLNDAEHGLIGLGFEEHSHWTLSGLVWQQIRALNKAANGDN